MVTASELIELAENAIDESDLLDFKREFTPENKSAFWVETVKDLVAMANSRGGALVFGINDDGTDSGVDCSQLFSFDVAKIADQIRKYTGYDFSDIQIKAVKRQGGEYPCIVVSPVSIPLVFEKVGTYELSPGEQKSAFSKGTIYVRHGAKSEPATRADIQVMIDRELARIREEWLGNIRKVVEAEPGATIVVTHSAHATSEVRVSNSPDAPEVRLPRLSDGYPLRQGDVIRKVNEALEGRAKINTHDIQCIKHVDEVTDAARPDLVAKPHEKSAPQYSEAFVRHIIDKFEENIGYFEECRKKFKADKY